MGVSSCRRDIAFLLYLSANSNKVGMNSNTQSSCQRGVSVLPRPGISTTVAACSSEGQARWIVIPSLLVDRSRLCWQTPATQAEKYPVVIWHRVDLYGTGPGWHQAIRGIPAPGKDDTPIGNHFHILAPNGVLFVERNLKLPP